MSHDVFISYSNLDKEVADEACAALEENGIRCWMAPRDIVPGLEWSEAITSAIEKARIFLLIFSENSNRSGQVIKEVVLANGHGLPLIPFRVEDVLPSGSFKYHLSSAHWLDAFRMDSATAFRSLVEAAQRILEIHRPDERPTGESRPPRATPARLQSKQPRSKMWIAAGAAAIVVTAAAGAYLYASAEKGPTIAVGNPEQILLYRDGTDERSVLVAAAELKIQNGSSSGTATLAEASLAPGPLGSFRTAGTINPVFQSGGGPCPPAVRCISLQDLLIIEQPNEDIDIPAGATRSRYLAFPITAAACEGEACSVRDFRDAVAKVRLLKSMVFTLRFSVGGEKQVSCSLGEVNTDYLSQIGWTSLNCS